MKGRKRKPYLLAKQEGRTHHESRPKCVDACLGDFEPPFELDEVAKREWDRMRVEAPWILAVNALLLAERCRAHSELQRACKLIDDAGVVVETRTGLMVKNPACEVSSQLRQYILRADAEMGLTPCSQNKVSATDAGKQKASIEDQMFGS